MMNDNALPLSRFTVLDLTRVRAGPTAARQFADWGANVIKIEPPESIDKSKGMGGARHGPDYQNIHRNKRSITLNLKDPEGIALLKRLAAKADVLIENYRPDVKSRLGIDYESLRKVNPRLVYASISGFGQDGPYVKRPGFDQIAQGMGGLMSITGLPGQGPVRAGIPVADLTAGMYCAIGILIALLEREVTGEGQWVQSSLLQAQIAMLDFQAARWLIGHEVPPQAGNNHPTSIPTGVFRTADGYINIAAAGQHMWERLCKELGAEDLLSVPEFATQELRSEHRDRVNAELEAHTVKLNSSELIDSLNKAGVPCGPIYTIDKMFEDPQVKHLRMAVPVDSPILGKTHVVGQAINLSRHRRDSYTPAPERGQHTDEVLAEFGLQTEEIVDLRKHQIV
jgi:crotonobetainyl-CoA:carnitine CoA-transferase CaiB-like acyl-CoA transferase